LSSLSFSFTGITEREELPEKLFRRGNKRSREITITCKKKNPLTNRFRQGVFEEHRLSKDVSLFIQ